MTVAIKPQRATTTGEELLERTRALCDFATGVTSPINEAFFARLAEEVPLELHRYASGETFNGWVVPEAWSVERAIVRHRGGVVFDGLAHPLAVASLSKSFRGTIDRVELAKHVVSNPRLPNAYVYHSAWQYRPWDADWMLSMPHALFEALPDGNYDVELVTRRDPGEMLLGEHTLPGADPRMIVLNAHTCHPVQANDDFAGVSVLVSLFHWLRARPRRYTYRFIFGPEHLGTVFYLRDRPESELERLVCGVFAEMPGAGGPIKLASSFLGDQPIDHALGLSARDHAPETVTVPWREGAGNDETVWEAPGYEVPFVEMSRSKSFAEPYPEYHTSLDTPDLLDAGMLESFLTVLQGALEVLETDVTARRRFDGLICLSNPELGLYLERPDPAIHKRISDLTERWGRFQDSVLRYFDGTVSAMTMARRHELPYSEVRRYLQRFADKGLVTLTPTWIERHPVTRSGVST